MSENLCSSFKKGSIINIGSDLSIKAPDQSLYKHLNTTKPFTYSIIKSAIHGLTNILQHLWGKDKNVYLYLPEEYIIFKIKLLLKKLIKKYQWVNGKFS